MLADIIAIVRDNWLLLLIGQYPNGPLGGFAATLILSVLSHRAGLPAQRAACARAAVAFAACCSGRRLRSSTSRAACRC